MVDQKSLGGVAHTYALSLRVDDERHRGLEVDAGIRVDMAVSTAGLDDGHCGLLDDGLDEPRPTARHEHIDEPASLHKRCSPGSSGGINGCDQVSGQAGGDQGGAQNIHNRRVGMRGGTAAAQHDGIAGLQRQGGNSDSDIGTGLVDHADHAHGNAHTAHPKTVGKGLTIDDLADRIGQAGDLAQRNGDGGDAVGGQAQAVDQPFGHALSTGALDIVPVGGQDLLGRLQKAISHGMQSGVLELTARRSHGSLRASSGSGRAGDQFGRVLLIGTAGMRAHGSTIRRRTRIAGACLAHMERESHPHPESDD